MKVAVAIMAHRQREEWAELLAERVGCSVVYDEDESTASGDAERRWRTGYRAWHSLVSSGADWGVVLQDDALVCDEFVPTLQTALLHVPNMSVVSLYSSYKDHMPQIQKAALEAKEADKSWFFLRSLAFGVGIAAPLKTVPRMLLWTNHPKMAGTNYDYRIGVYYRDRLHYRAIHPIPSLVQHRDQGTLVGVSRGVRRATHFLGENKSGVLLDWSKI